MKNLAYGLIIFPSCISKMADHEDSMHSGPACLQTSSSSFNICNFKTGSFRVKTLKAVGCLG